MQKLDFGEALDYIASRDPRYSREAYLFLRDALDFTVKQRRKAKDGSAHVSGQQLLEGVRLYALKQFGPMVLTVFQYWGLNRCEDFGEMVFNLIRIGVFGKTERDSVEDFKGAYTFHDAFVAPYLPALPVVHRRMQFDYPAGELS
jgi:uncharacterized repeat protein (TIGR04138 family)